jgi:hypothetical protein
LGRRTHKYSKDEILDLVKHKLKEQSKWVKKALHN